jgi:2-polyprenyl-3-methyl-5-hydroxy-6-metoxy-1,4-benzoquinol methylase
MLPDRTQDFFHRYADGFDAIYSNKTGLANDVVNRVLRKSMKLRFLKSIAGCSPIRGRSVLDVGCGPGHYSITLAQGGAARILGLDFAEGMLDLARQHAERAGVAEKCQFVAADFLSYRFSEIFDYVIVMGFMDYMKEARAVVEKVLSVTGLHAFFSFPAAGGILAWQRKLRYRSRCELFLYTQANLENLLRSLPGVEFQIERIARDFFVTASPSRRLASVATSQQAPISSRM